LDEPRDSATFRTVVMGLGLSLVFAVLAIGLIIGFGRQESGGLVVHRSGEQTYWGPHRRALAPGKGAHRPNVLDKADIAHTTSGPARVPENLWLIVAALFGALVGLLVPTPRLTTDGGLRAPDFLGLIAFALAALFIVLFSICGHLGTARDDGILIAAGAALFGILIPSPARYDSI
jgi:hypothetical protein